MEKCVILCRLKMKKDDGLTYEHHKTVCIGHFSDHESAGEFMTEYMDNDQSLIECLNLFYKDQVESVDHWEVADLVDRDHVASNWTDHDSAKRSTQERGKYSF